MAYLIDFFRQTLERFLNSMLGGPFRLFIQAAKMKKQYAPVKTIFELAVITSIINAICIPSTRVIMIIIVI